MVKSINHVFKSTDLKWGYKSRENGMLTSAVSDAMQM